MFIYKNHLPTLSWALLFQELDVCVGAQWLVWAWLSRKKPAYVMKQPWFISPLLPFILSLLLLSTFPPLSHCWRASTQVNTFPSLFYSLLFSFLLSFCLNPQPFPFLILIFIPFILIFFFKSKIPWKKTQHNKINYITTAKNISFVFWCLFL